MQEEDRVRALNLYGDIFDEVGNDTAVLQLVVSPTRQAVNLARAYDAKDRGGQAESRPAFLGVIDELRRQAESLLPPIPEKVEDGQLSLFGEPERSENVFESFGFDLPQEDEPEDAEEEPPADLADGVTRFPDEDRAEDNVLPQPAPIIPAAEPEKKTPDQELDEFADSVAAFLADFPPPEEKPAQKEEETPAAEAEPAPPVEEPQPPVEEPQPSGKDAATWSPPPSTLPNAPAKPNVPEMKETVPVVGLLVLCIVLAIPVGIVCIGLLLGAALVSLGLAAAALSMGLYGFVTAFTAFSVFADILLVFGLSLVLVALGLLLFWLFIWLLAGAIPAFVRAVVGFIRKHCYKEVTL